MNYANADNLTSFTSTYRPPTKEECKEEIITAMLRYSQKRWYQEKKYLLKKAKRYAKILLILNK